MKRILMLAALVLPLVGCDGGTVSAAQTADLRKEYSRENYEREMRAKGRGAEVDAQRQEAAERGEP